MFVNTGISTTIPSGLVELEYIESTGTQYIDTGFKPNNNTRVVMDLQLLSTSGIPYVFGTWAGGMNNCFSVYWWTDVHNSWGVDYGTQRSAISQTNWNKRLTVDLNQNVVTVDGVSYTLTTTTFTATKWCPKDSAEKGNMRSVRPVERRTLPATGRNWDWS